MILTIAAGSMLAITSCKKEGCTDPAALNYNADIKEKNDDGSCIYPYTAVDTVYVNGNITADETWVTGKTYILTTRVAVTSGATLTIEPGVIVKGEAGTGANATALIIARGAKLMALGTATEPIIFTSIADQIVPGEIASPNLSTSLDGLWGGVIVLGNAQISADAATIQIEGIPVSDPNGLYGGSDNADNSGVIQYISIRHGGSNIGEGNEINGLTLGGVGTGTVIDHIEVIANQDDGVEIFGGSVNLSDVIVINCGDDAIDTDQNWIGTLTNFIVINAGDKSMELDGPEGATLPGNFTLTNGSIQGGGASGLVDNDPNTNGDLNNIFFFDLSVGQTFNAMPAVPVTVSNLQANLPSGEVLTTFFLDGSDAFVTEVALGSQTVGATKSAFYVWTWTAIHADDYLADF